MKVCFVVFIVYSQDVPSINPVESIGYVIKREPIRPSGSWVKGLDGNNCCSFLPAHGTTLYSWIVTVPVSPEQLPADAQSFSHFSMFLF